MSRNVKIEQCFDCFNTALKWLTKLNTPINFVIKNDCPGEMYKCTVHADMVCGIGRKGCSVAIHMDIPGARVI